VVQLDYALKMPFLPTCTGIKPLQLWHWRNFVTAACWVNSTKLPLILNAVTKVTCTLLIYLMNAVSRSSAVQQLSD